MKSKTPVKATTKSKLDAKTRFQQIYNTIRERICLLQFPPGMLLSENGLAAEFGISRTPIRRVLQRLEYEGLVSSQHGVGTLVTTVDIKLLKEVYILRIKLAELIGELTPVIFTIEDDLQPLEDLLIQCNELQGRRDPIALGRINLALNNTIVSFIGNQPLQEITDRLFYQTARVWQQLLSDMNWEQEVELLAQEISQIIEALRTEDTKKFGQIRRDHIALCLNRMNQYLVIQS